MKISQEIVDKVYERILNEGGKPTVRNVRDELVNMLGKGGAMDDIARMLRVSKEGGEKTLPQRIVELEREVKELKEILRNHISQLVQ